MLAGQLSYDDVAERDQAAVRAAWREGIDADLASLDLRTRFEGQGRTRWSEADDRGNVHVHLAADDDASATSSTGSAVTGEHRAR